MNTNKNIWGCQVNFFISLKKGMLKMAESNEWKTKGASLTVEKASLEFGVRPDIILGWINAGNLEFRRGATNGKPWTKVLRSQVERLINQDPVGALHLTRMEKQAALIKVEQNINHLQKILAEFQEQKMRIEIWLAANPMPQ